MKKNVSYLVEINLLKVTWLCYEVAGLTRETVRTHDAQNTYHVYGALYVHIYI